MNVTIPVPAAFVQTPVRDTLLVTMREVTDVQLNTNPVWWQSVVTDGEVLNVELPILDDRKRKWSDRVCIGMIIACCCILIGELIRILIYSGLLIQTIHLVIHIVTKIINRIEITQKIRQEYLKCNSYGSRFTIQTNGKIIKIHSINCCNGLQRQENRLKRSYNIKEGGTSSIQNIQSMKPFLIHYFVFVTQIVKSFYSFICVPFHLFIN